MTVKFTANPAPAVPALDLDQLLLPQLKPGGHTNFTPGPAVLRVLCRALASGVTATHARRWLVKNGSSELLTLVTSNARFFPLVTKARAHVALHSSPSGQAAARTTVARRLVARLTTPIAPGTISARRELSARLALAVIGAHQIDLGYEKVLISAGWLAARLGMTVKGSQQVLSTLEKDLKWIARHGRRVDGIRWKLTRLGGEEERERAWLHAPTVDALAALTPHDDPLAAIISTAAHEAWCYSWTADEKPARILGVRHWVALVHAHAGLPPDEGLGLPVSAIRRLRRELDVRLPDALTAESDLLLDLDALAEITGATARRAESDAKTAAVSAATKKRFAEFQARQAEELEVKRTVGRALRRAQHVDGPLGPIPTDASGLQAWTSAAAAYFIAGEGAEDIGAEHAVIARSYLVKHIVERGHADARAEQVAKFVFRDSEAAA